MAAKIQKKFSISAKGILAIDNDTVSIENEDTGELVNLADLFLDFADKDVSLSLTYNEDYE